MGKKNGGPKKTMTVVVKFRPVEGMTSMPEDLTVDISGTGTADRALRLYDPDGVLLFLFPLDMIRSVQRTALFDYHKNLLS